MKHMLLSDVTFSKGDATSPKKGNINFAVKITCLVDDLTIAQCYAINYCRERSIKQLLPYLVNLW